MENKAKEYEIMSFDDLCNTITSENKDRLLSDLVLAFNGYVQTMEATKKLLPELADTKNSEIAQFGFVWIDDGKNERHGTIIEGPTGERVEIKPI